MHELVSRHHANSEFEIARRTLDDDGNSANRAMALLVLSSFTDRDAAWWAVTDALRDPSSGMVNATASQVLRLMTERAARPVDWSPMAERLRYIVDGTNLFGFDGMLRALAATSINPSLAPTLLASGGGLIRAKLHSGDAWARDAAREFLARLSGLPPTTDLAAFDAWLDQMSGSARSR
jgi:hypothetical protein